MTKEDFLKRCKAKKFRTFRGHDGPNSSLEFDLHFDGKFVTNVYDDSYGGGFQYSNFNELKSLFESIEKDTLKHDNLSDDEIELSKTLNIVFGIDSLIDDIVNKVQREKDQKKGILVKVQGGYQIIGYKYVLPTMFKKYRGMDVILQKKYNELVSDGKEIINTEYLATLGIIV